MYFRLITASKFEVDDSWSLPVVVLQPLSWNDWWRWKTLYFASLVDAQGNIHDLGSVKIADLEATYEEATDGTGGTRTFLEESFEELPKGYASLGQDETYYQALWRLLGKAEMRLTLRAMKDLAIDRERFQKRIGSPTVSRSLARSVPFQTVEQTFANIAFNGDPKRSFSFTFTKPSQNPFERNAPIVLEFDVEPGSTPPTNVHVLIGRNGSGKTTLLQSMTRALLGTGVAKEQDGALSTSTGAPHAGIANVVYVAFSAFDDLAVPVHDSPSQWAVPYSFIGLQALPRKDQQRIDEATGKAIRENRAEPTVSAYSVPLPRRTRRPMELAHGFAKSAAEVVTKSPERWRSALKNLESDPNFKDAAVSDLADEGRLTSAEARSDFEERAAKLFRRLSSGHKIVLLTTTRLVETVTAETLVILDEPEAHLHPPLLSAFTRALSDLMQQQNGLAIIATHSPVILQEVPVRCVRRVQRSGKSQRIERVEIESFGENIGTLTNAVFGLEVRDSGFHKMILELASESGGYDAVVEQFKGELGFEARALLHSWFARRESDLG
ncbi:AAA family ATPase [Curtobacterium sp. MCBA15_013]|uniref:AAA family ATPase n=1 Tax=Curtobacterium sp. MCBA15_013 TaxID=1898739 RepID=UPI0009F6CEF4|nr:AAA family ATPase [Curtobacterium sp. MCBA15_013]